MARTTRASDIGGEEPQGAVIRALRLLRAFERAESPQTLSELARGVDLAPSTASRLLGILEEAGFVSRGADRRYRLGPRVVQLGLLGLRRISLYDAALPHLHRLAAETGESTTLGVPDGDQISYLAHVPSAEPVRHVEWAGSSVPRAGTAIGSAVSGRVGPEGYASTRRTVESGVTAIAAPVHGATGEVVAAVSVTGPSFRISDEDIRRIGGHAVAHARELSRDLGHARDPDAGCQ
jgi:IclR family acetate operon transcriptional repressor